MVSDVVVISKARDADKAYKATYTAEEEKPQIQESVHEVGSTIKVIKPFLRDRLRRDDLVKNCRTIFRSLIELMQTYAVIFPDRQFEMSHFADGRNVNVFSYLRE